ncbi:hypothetical protein [Reyranella sp.]|uniref:hypothetical protein n=1 Tax=Reyranella sp. TaxID=1929291 RepID=UPI004036D69F
MRPPVIALALFCDSIRREIGGIDSLVGILPDSVALEEIPGMVPRIAFYLRLQIDPKIDPNPMEITIRMLDGSRESLGQIDAAVVNRARELAADKPYAGVIVRSHLAPVAVAAPGRIEAYLSTGVGEEILCAHLTFLRQEGADSKASSSSTEPTQQLERSSSAPQAKEKKPGPSRPSRRRASPKQRP